MLSQRVPPDPNCNLIITSFLTLPHLLVCLICTRNAISIVLLFQMMRGWDRLAGWLIYIKVWVRGQGVVIILQFCFVFFLVLYFVVSRSQSLYLGG